MTPLPDRLALREWHVDDAAAALSVYSHPEVVRWLVPDMDRVPGVAAMRLLLQQWIAESTRITANGGRWAVYRTADGRVVGGAVLLPLPPGDEDWEIGWQLHPGVWGQGHEEACAFTLASLAFERGHSEVFAVVRPGNTTPSAAAVRRNGMHWVGDTGKYFGVDLQVFRLRKADFDRAAPEGHQPPTYADT
jgi:RimJ/RimL family protein N-acetyltransferase